MHHLAAAKNITSLQFVHVPKTGGSALEAFSAQRGRLDLLGTKWGQHNDELSSGTNCIKTFDGHKLTPPACFVQLDGGDTCAAWGLPPEHSPALQRAIFQPQRTSFCVLRNPFDRITSAYRDLVDDGRSFFVSDAADHRPFLSRERWPGCLGPLNGGNAVFRRKAPAQAAKPCQYARLKL